MVMLMKFSSLENSYPATRESGEAYTITLDGHIQRIFVPENPYRLGKWPFYE
jgi:hypothetical protein